MSSLRVGLTGGLASGKSTVARQLASAGFAVVDADRLVADLYRPGEAGAELVARLLGEEMLAADGSVDRARVARRIFDDPDARKRLERAIHPLVRQRFGEIAASRSGVVVLEATKLLEAGYAPDFDLVVTVEAAEPIRIRRAIRRGLSEQEARARIAAQSGERQRRDAADLVIENDAGRRELHRRVDQLIAELERRQAERISRR